MDVVLIGGKLVLKKVTLFWAELGAMLVEELEIKLLESPELPEFVSLVTDPVVPLDTGQLESIELDSLELLESPGTHDSNSPFT